MRFLLAIDRQIPYLGHRTPIPLAFGCIIYSESLFRNVIERRYSISPNRLDMTSISEGSAYEDHRFKF